VRTAVLYTSMLSMVVAFVVWSMISPIAPQLQSIYHLSSFSKSIVVATPVLLGSLFRIPLGMLTDRFGGRLVYTLLMVYLVIPLVGISTAHTFRALIFWEVLLGVAGTSFAVGIGHVSAWFPPERQGLVLGITALGNIGTAVAGFTVPTLFLAIGLRNTFLVMIVPVLLAAAALWLFTRDPQPEPKPKSAENASTEFTAEAFWGNSHLWSLSLYYFITFGGFVAFGNYLPTLLQSQFQLSPVSAGFRSSGFVVLATFIRPVGGYLADRIRPNWLLWAVFLLLGVFASLLAVGLYSMPLTTVSALAIAALLGIGNGSVFKLVPLYFPGKTGKATGIVGAIGGLGGFFPPLVMGAIYQATGNYAGGLLLLAASCVGVLVVSLLQERREGRGGGYDGHGGKSPA